MKRNLKNVKEKSPLIHNITNYVTVNDCANIVLACGASPIMSDEKDEVEEITSICGGLNINIGTLNKRTIESMIIAGKKANELGHPVILDPVGAGASNLRTNTALKLMEEVKFSVIRGNISEIKTIAGVSATTQGVDANVADKITEESLDNAVEFAKSFAKRIGAVVAITGEIDIVSNGEKAYCIRNGHSMMSSVTGTGCMLSAVIAAYVTANMSVIETDNILEDVSKNVSVIETDIILEDVSKNVSGSKTGNIMESKENMLKAAAAAVCAMGLAGEIAYSRMSELDGNSSYRNYIIDAIYNMTEEEFEKGAKYEVR